MKNVPVKRLSLWSLTETKVKLFLYLNARLLVYFIFASFLLVKCICVTGNDKTLFNVIHFNFFFLSFLKYNKMRLISVGKFNRLKNSFNPLMRGGNKRSYVLKQTCSF